MKAHFSILKYYPDNNREDGFSIGLVLTQGKSGDAILKFSTERIRRINNAFGIKKSKLIEMSLLDLQSRDFSKESLDYLAAYENGNLRFTKPQIVVSDFIKIKFDELYSKYVADYYEEDYLKDTDMKYSTSPRIGQFLRKRFQSNHLLNSRLNIGYDFKDNYVSNFLIGNTNIDFIGGNGTVFSGEIINLELSEESLQKSLFKTITLFEALEKTYKAINKFEPSNCKLLVLEHQAKNPEKVDYMHKLSTWQQKAGYDLIIRKELADFESDIQKEVDSKNIKKFEDWVKTLI